MTNPTNWPNPERPDVPMFPERDGWHFLTGVLYSDFWMMDLWNAGTKSWGDGSILPDLAARRCVYGGPVRNPTQIAELLAGERERCLTIVIDEQWNFPSNPLNQTKEAAVAFKACERIIEKIRNLGAAP